jgi:hypothetical protein
VAATCAAILALAASPALAVQRYASPGGSGSACSQSSPCAIQIALNNASTGDEVIVNPGDYSPPLNLFTPATNVYVHGADGQPVPRIHFSAGGFLNVENTGNRASRLTLFGGNSAPLETTSGAEADQIVAVATAAGQPACYVYATLIDSVCWSSGASGFGVDAKSSAAFTITLRNDTLMATGSGGQAVEIDSDTGGTVTANLTNVIARGAGGIQFNEASSSSLTGNVDHSNTGSITGTGTGSPAINATNNQTTAPLFVNAAAGDFREAAGSPTIDFGVTSPLNGPFDFLGKPRTINGLTDIGADEFDPFSGVDLSNQSSRVKKRKVRVPIGCPAGTPTSCAGTLALTYGKKTAGSTSFSIPTGAAKILRVKMSKKALKKLARRSKLVLQATATATDGAGTAGTATAKVKLKG